MDAINTFDASTQDAAAFGFKQPIKGDGYALTHDPATSKWRADVWDGNGVYRAAPKIGGHTLEPAVAALMAFKLMHDFDAWIDVREQVRLYGIWDGTGDPPPSPLLRERLEPGYTRAVALRDAMVAMYG